ncbi:MAG: hypothetical protein V3T05_09430 [Myxococcota bacterium]
MVACTEPTIAAELHDHLTDGQNRAGPMNDGRRIDCPEDREALRALGYVE